MSSIWFVPCRSFLQLIFSDCLLQERAAPASAQLHIESDGGSGVQLSIEIPALEQVGVVAVVVDT